MKTKMYPEAGSRAETVLQDIASNPGTTKNAVITRTKLNPSVVKKCVDSLLARELISDEPDNSGNHHYSIRRVM